MATVKKSNSVDHLALTCHREHYNYVSNEIIISHTKMTMYHRWVQYHLPIESAYIHNSYFVIWMPYPCPCILQATLTLNTQIACMCACTYTTIRFL